MWDPWVFSACFSLGEDSLANYSDTGLELTILALVSPGLESLLKLLTEGLEIPAKAFPI